MAQNQLEDYLAGMYQEQAESQERAKLAEALEQLSVEQLETLLNQEQVPAAPAKTKTAAARPAAAPAMDPTQVDPADAAFLQKFAEAVGYAREMAHRDFLKTAAPQLTPPVQPKVKQASAPTTIPMAAYYAVIQSRIGG